ncbi:capsid cement protein [Mycobacterium celatum]|uniref:DUF2190 domain-containing protein n=1 Tax=Mycobacterium celatum TaxID=28045 RepID=A0A2G5PQL0_MYCCE|nr:capsid cement protein [Mycobacterium celatum]PIB80556.1 DUF2190 domain-containing protein [Mycobacterium celatum]
MAGQDYVPLYTGGNQVSCVAGANITAGQLVAITGGTLSGGGVTPTVSPTSAATSAAVGVAAQTVASGQPVSVYFGGVHLLAASGAISAGDPVVAAANGGVADLGSGTTYDQVVGHAWSAPAGGQVVVRLAEI